ncbi:MAG: hypothetical protein EKK55_12955 [Rhodocyclaceae bacterium]|nr:MAG: hypothetical protein EKK55_12955 [Rhodocyclaceae bacterium]
MTTCATTPPEGKDALGWQRPLVPGLPHTAAESALANENAAIRSHIQARPGETTEAALLRFIAAADLKAAEATRRTQDAERAAFRELTAAQGHRAALRRIRALTEGLHDVDTPLDPARIADRVAEVVAERDSEREGNEAGMATMQRLAAKWAAEKRRADGLERVAQRRPVAPSAPGPSMLHPMAPAIPAAAFDAAKALACDACSQAVGAIADALGLDDASPADVAKVACRLVDDLDALAESVGGGDDPASVVADLRRGIAELRAELRRERAGHLAVLDHLREAGGDLAVLRAQIDQGTARALADATGGAR